MTGDSPGTTHEYLEALFGDGRGFLVAWRLQDRAPAWFCWPEKGAEAAAWLVGQSQKGFDVYVCMSLQRARLPASSRGTAANAAGIGGLWVDIDVHDPRAHKAPDLPESERDVLGAMLEFPAPPTMLVWSGHGLYALWLLREFWWFEEESDRARAAGLLEHFQAALRTVWARKGWRLDPTHDLARLLRPVGTVNYKVPKDPKPVAVHPLQASRYNVSDLEEAADALPHTPARQGSEPAAVPDVILEGRRNTALASIAGALRRRGVNPAGPEGALLAINRVQCSPPLPEDEVKRIARSVSRYPPARPAPARREGDAARGIAWH